MNLELANKIALVTGASSGIGAATAKVLAEEGADVVVAYGQDRQGAKETADAVKAFGRTSRLCRMDITKPNVVAKALQRVRKNVPRLDILVLCAGYNVVTPLEKISPIEWDKVITTNLSSAFYVLQASLPLFSDNASIVIVSSVAAHTGAPHHAHYAAAKAGVVNLTKSAARSLAPHIRVNCVAPGITLTPMGQATTDTLAPDYAKTKLLSQRFALPEEIARCIAFVASPAAGFMTGATIDINGGRDLR